MRDRSRPRVLVTGAGGVVGHALCDALAECGAELSAIRSRSDCNLEDLAETRAVFSFVRPEEVYHLAGAVFGVGGNLAFPGEAFFRNVAINTNVVEAARLAGARKIVAMGSTAMYGDGAPLPMREEDATSGRPHGSEEAYGFAKRALLVQLESYERQYGLDYGFAIATNMYGPHDRFDPQYGHVIPSLVHKFVAAAGTETEVEIWGDGSPTRDFLYAEDAARGVMLLMRSGRGAYNLATNETRTIRDLVGILQRLFPDVRVRWDATKPLGQLRRAYDISRIGALGFRPACSLEEGLARTVEWYRENRASTRARSMPAAAPAAASALR
ncbi:MAG: NAD-dependent epimerase/dehydratase family protein [Alphaproteobacteria bacterium]|nr:NAD-dependent epimerase/dehydratase family protein [Alphaproteobacteria bacterium]